MKNTDKKIVFILSVSSDIGSYVARKYLEAGHTVIGSYRQKKNIKSLLDHPKCHLFPCDIRQKASFKEFIRQVKGLHLKWDMFISCVGYLLPAQPFFDCDFEQWSDSVHVNSLDQLRVLHALYPLRNKGGRVDVVFFAGGGVNNAVKHISAYTISKIMLIKMCEYLDYENKDLNVFILGPGWTKTKIHKLILDDKKSDKEKYSETKEAYKTKQGTPLGDIYECMEWLCRQDKEIASGRNFSVVHDAWQEKGRAALLKALKSNPDMYKLRRNNNNFTPHQG